MIWAIHNSACLAGCWSRSSSSSWISASLVYFHARKKTNGKFKIKFPKFNWSATYRFLPHDSTRRDRTPKMCDKLSSYWWCNWVNKSLQQPFVLVNFLASLLFKYIVYRPKCVNIDRPLTNTDLIDGSFWLFPIVNFSLVAFILNKWCDEFDRRPSLRLFHRPASVCGAQLLFIDLEISIDLLDDFICSYNLFCSHILMNENVCVCAAYDTAQINKVILWPIPNQSFFIVRQRHSDVTHVSDTPSFDPIFRNF